MPVLVYGDYVVYRGAKRVGVFQALVHGLTADRTDLLRRKYALASRTVLCLLSVKPVCAGAFVIEGRGYQKHHPVSFVRIIKAPRGLIRGAAYSLPIIIIAHPISEFSECPSQIFSRLFVETA